MHAVIVILPPCILLSVRPLSISDGNSFREGVVKHCEDFMGGREKEEVERVISTFHENKLPG